MKLILAVLDVSLTMGLARCYKTRFFLHLYIIGPNKMLSYRRETALQGALYFFRQK